MKKLIFILLLFFSVQAISQQSKPEFRLNAYAGYVFDDKFDSYYSNTSYYNGKIKGAFQWGIGVEYALRSAYGIELSYMRQDTKAPTTYYDDAIIGGGVKTKDFDMAINYIMLGTIRYFKIKPAIEPYFGVGIGAAIVNVSNPANGNSANGSKFAWSFKGGSNFWLSDRVGIKLQAGLSSVVEAVGGALYFGSNGVSTGLSSYSTVLQFALGSGLVFKLSGGKK